MDESADLTELRRLRARVAELERDRLAASKSSPLDDLQQYYRTAPVGLCVMDAELRVVHVNEMLAAINGKSVAEHIGRTLREVIPEIAELVEPTYRRVLETGEPALNMEVRADAPGKPHHLRSYLASYYPCALREGSPAGVSTVVQDVTDLKKAEHWLRTTIRELDHRVKNTLSTVQVLAEHTARSSTSLAEFSRAFRGRIDALARMHAPLTDETSASTGLRELVSLIVLPLSAETDSVSIEGDDVTVSSTSVRPVGLALHELATNAAKFGALSTKDGHVTVSWQTDPTGDGHALRILWAESGGPDVQTPSRRGFGSMLIEQTLPYELGGEVAFDFPRTGVRCEILLPVREGVL